MTYPDRITYDPTAIALHWLTLLLLLTAVPLGLIMIGMKLSPLQLKLISWHKWVGVTLFALSALRLLWRIAHPAPALPAYMPAWQKQAAAGLHVLLYMLLLAIPLTGWLMSSAKGFQTVWLGVLPIPDLLAKDKALGELLAGVHKGLNITLLLAVTLHVAAALKHHLVDRDDVLGRMLPWLKTREERS